MPIGISFPDFSKIAEAFGFEYLVCNNNNEVKDTLGTVINSKKRYFLEVKQEIGNTVSPRIKSRMKEDGSFETPVLHDMFPFLSKDELNALMFSNWKSEA